MNSVSGSEPSLPVPLKYLHALLTAAEDAHEARSNVVAIYDGILLYALRFPDKRDTALMIWTKGLGGLASTPSGQFDNVWQELIDRRVDLIDYIYEWQSDESGEELFMGLRVEEHTRLLLSMLLSGYDGQFADFVTKLVEEQPKYFDRPSDIDTLLQQRTQPDSFPTLPNMLMPGSATGDKMPRTVLIFLAHHIAYICDLFNKTDYSPSAEVVKSLAGYRISQLSRMFADPTSHVPVQIREHCASINHRTIQDIVVLRAKELLQSTDKEYLNWHMYQWLLSCVKKSLLDDPRTTKLFNNIGLGEVARADAVEQAYYVPRENVRLTVPLHMIEQWQNYDPAALEDLRFKAVGPRILAKSVAKPVQPGIEATCSVCLELFAVRKASTVAWKVACGHVFHAQCLESMINGIEKNSNCCPLCRTEICAARERRRIMQNDIESEEESGGD
jgi:hypothetical protein